MKSSFVFALMTMFAMDLSAKANEWPVIRPVNVIHTFRNRTTGSDTPFSLSIRNSEGVPVYSLECHNGNYENNLEMNFSGDFQCGLFAIRNGSRVSGNLLAANTKNESSTDWWNRGRMRSAQLRGTCLDYPEYSTDRTFKLRGMRLTLRFTNMKWSPRDSREHDQVLTGFTFTFTAIPDESSSTARADVVPGPAPPAPCYP